jgi:periplasmic protein TonB
MKTSPVLILGLGLLLAGSVLAQPSPATAEWQSLKILQTVEPIFPYHLMQLTVTEGDARVVINVDATGKLAEWLVIGYTQPEFADAAVAAIKQWQFEPARYRGMPVGAISELNFHFSARGVVISQNVCDLIEAYTTRMLDGHYTFQPCPSSELDRPPAVITSVTPVYPKALADKGVHGQVTVEFYIDQTGAVRLPSVTTQDNVELGALAVEAVGQWKFTPPTSRGRGVLVKAVQVFNFKDGS